MEVKKDKEVVKKKFKFKDKKKMIILGIMTFLFIILAVLIKTHWITPFDSLIESFVIGIRNDTLTKVMITITNISRAYFLISISIILLFIIRNKKIPILIIINLVCVFLSSQLLKVIFTRNRPDGEALVEAFGYSFPSGHAMVSLAYFGFILYLINKKIKKKMTKTFLTIITIILIFAIGFSRIYLGVHFASDVIGGFVLAIGYLMIFLMIVNSLENKE